MRSFFWALSIGIVTAFGGEASAPADSASRQAWEAKVTAVSGQVSRIRDEQPWALSKGERVPIQQIITTGPDGYAHFEITGGSSFDMYSNSRVVFRTNAASSGDLLDLQSGKVRIHFQLGIGQPQQRVFSPVAIVSAHQSATVAMAVDEDDAVRIDVIAGAVRVQHTLLPRNEPVLVKAVDAILVQRDQPISHKVDRGSLYRYSVKILSALTLGHAGSRSGDPIEQNKFLPVDRSWRDAEDCAAVATPVTPLQ